MNFRALGSRVVSLCFVRGFMDQSEFLGMNIIFSIDPKVIELISYFVFLLLKW